MDTLKDRKLHLTVRNKSILPWEWSNTATSFAKRSWSLCPCRYSMQPWTTCVSHPFFELGEEKGLEWVTFRGPCQPQQCWGFGEHSLHSVCPGHCTRTENSSKGDDPRVGTTCPGQLPPWKHTSIKPGYNGHLDRMLSYHPNQEKCRNPGELNRDNGNVRLNSFYRFIPSTLTPLALACHELWKEQILLAQAPMESKVYCCVCFGSAYTLIQLGRQ